MQTPTLDTIPSLLVALIVSALIAWHIQDVLERAEYRFFIWGVSVFGALAIGTAITLPLAGLLMAAALGRLSVRFVPSHPLPQRERSERVRPEHVGYIRVSG